MSLYNIRENRPEALRVGGPGENTRGTLQGGGGGGGWGENCYRVQGAETLNLLKLAE